MFQDDCSNDGCVAYAEEPEYVPSEDFYGCETDDMQFLPAPQTNVFEQTDETSVPLFPTVRVKQEPEAVPSPDAITEEAETEAAADSGATSPNTPGLSSDSYVPFPPVYAGAVQTTEPTNNSSLMPPTKRSRSSSSAHKVPSAPAPDAKPVGPVSEPTNEDIEELFHKSSAEVEQYARALDEAGILTPELDSKIRHVCRQVKNRESAQLSRMRKRQYVTALSSALEKERNEAASAKMSAESAAAERDYEKSVSEIWRNYAQSLRQAIAESRIPMTLPPMPEIPVYIPPKVAKPTHSSTDNFFSGPSGFGHLSRSKRH